MKSEQEIQEAIKAAQRRKEGIDYNDGKGAMSGSGKIAIMCDAQVEALKWVLEQDDGFVYGLKE